MHTENKFNRKEQIIQVAESLFKERGFMATTMRDLAKVLKIEAASLYSHIQSKDEILETICFRLGQEFNSAMDKIKSSHENAEDKLRRAILNHIIILTGDLNGSAVFLKEWRHLKREKLNEFNIERKKYENGFKEIVKQGERENIFSIVDITLTVQTILSTISWLVEWYKPGGKMSPGEIANYLADFIISGLKKNPAHRNE